MERSIDIGGRHLACIDSGGDGPPLVLVHGGGDNAGTWHDLLPRLAEHGRVIAVDLAGHGRSDPDPDLGPARGPRFHDDVDRLLDELGITDEPLLVGHSLGAPVVLALARLRPARALLLLDGAPHRGIFEPPPAFDAEAAEARMREMGFGELITGVELEARIAAVPPAEAGSVRRRFVEIGEDRFEHRPDGPTTLTMAAAGARADNPYRDLRLYADATVPTTYLLAERGTAADVRDAVDELLRDNPLLDVRWLDAGHSIHWERPDDVVDAVRELLQR